MIELGRRTKACLGSATVAVSAAVSIYAYQTNLPEESMLSVLGIQVATWGILPGLFLVWVALRRDFGAGAARRQDEVLPAEGNGNAPFDTPVFRVPVAVFSRTAVFLCSLGAVFALVYVPVVVFLGER